MTSFIFVHRQETWSQWLFLSIVRWSHWLHFYLQRCWHSLPQSGNQRVFFHCYQHLWHFAGFYTKGCPLVKSNLICPSDKLSWQLVTWLSSFKYQYQRKFLYQPRKWLFGQPARKLSVDPCFVCYSFDIMAFLFDILWYNMSILLLFITVRPELDAKYFAMCQIQFSLTYWKYFYFYSSDMAIHSQGPIKQVTAGSGNGLAQDRSQSITLMS